MFPWEHVFKQQASYAAHVLEQEYFPTMCDVPFQRATSIWSVSVVQGILSNRVNGLHLDIRAFVFH